MLRVLVPPFCCALLLSFGGCGDTGSNPGARTASPRTPERISVAVIPKGTTHAFWKSVEAGARKAGHELDIDVIWKGPLREDDLAQQKSIVEDFVAQKVSAIVLAPLNDAALAPSVANARIAQVPVVIIDSNVQGHAGRDFVSFVATDNHEAGRLGGRKLAELLGGKGRVVLLRYEAGHASTSKREQGFVDALKESDQIELVVDNRRGGADASQAQTAAENILDQLEAADGIFCPNESTTLGMLLALQKHGLAGKKRFVGFDASAPLLAGLRAGDLDALVIQDPTKMGYLGVKTAVEHLRGRDVEPRIDTGTRVVTRENVDDPDIRAMTGEGS